MLSASTMFTVAIPRNDDLFIIAPLRHSTGIIFNTREVLGTPFGGENIYPPQRGYLF